MQAIRRFIICLCALTFAACSDDNPTAPAADLSPGTIAYAAPSADAWGLFVINPDGGNPLLLADSLRSQPSIAWSPDGEQIAFTANTGLYTIRPDGTDTFQLTEALRQNSRLVWSPTGAAKSLLPPTTPKTGP
jgi:Tol biopolymer transport system component